MASLVLIWIPTVDDGHMTQLVIIAATNNISHLNETRKNIFTKLHISIHAYGAQTETN